MADINKMSLTVNGGVAVMAEAVLGRPSQVLPGGARRQGDDARWPLPEKAPADVLPKITSGANSAQKQQIVSISDKQQAQLIFQPKQEKAIPAAISAEFDIYHMQNKRPSRRQIRRVSKNSHKVIEDRLFLQKLAMNYYGSRPQNYLSKAENKTLKSQQVTALAYKKGSLQNYIQSKTIGAGRMHREHKRKSRYLGDESIVGRSKNQRKNASEDEEAAEIMRLKQQIQSEKEKVIAYWQMLHENVKLNDDELAQIIKDLSDFESEAEEFGAADNSLTRNDDPADIDQLERDKNQSILNTVQQSEARIQEQGAHPMLQPRQTIPAHEAQYSLAQQQPLQIPPNDQHQQALTIKRNRSTPFPRNLSTQKTKDRYKNDVVVQKVQLPAAANPAAQQPVKEESVTILTSYNPYKSTTPRSKKRNISQHDTATSKRQSDKNALSNNSNTGETRQVSNTHNGSISQNQRKTSVAVGIPLKQLKMRTSESNAELTPVDHFNQSQYSHQQPPQRVLISSMATQNNKNQSQTAYIPGQKQQKVPQTQSQLDHYKHPRRNLKQHLTPVQLNKKAADKTIQSKPGNNEPASAVTSPNPKKMKTNGELVQQLPQLKRDQIQFANQPPMSSPTKMNSNDAAKMYRSQDTESMKTKKNQLKKSNNQSIPQRSDAKALTSKLHTGKPLTQSESHLLEQKLMRPSAKQQNSHRQSHRHTEVQKSYGKLKLKYGFETAKESEVTVKHIVSTQAQADEAANNKKNESDGQMQSLGNTNVDNLMIIDEANQPLQSGSKPKFVKNRNGSIYDEQRSLINGEAPGTSHFNDMYNSLGPYESQKDSYYRSKNGKNRSEKREQLKDSIQLATQSIDETGNFEASQLLRDRSQHIAGELLLNRLKISDHRMLNQREQDKLRAQSKCRVRKIMEEQHVRSAKPNDYIEQGQPMQTKVEGCLKNNHAIRSRRLNKTSSQGHQLNAQSAQLGHGTSLRRLVEEARHERLEESEIYDDSGARQLERRQVCKQLLDTQKELRDFNLDIDAKFLEKDQSFCEMFHGNSEAIPGYNILNKQKQAQAMQYGRDTIEVYTSYLKNLTRSIQNMLGYQDRENEQTKKFQSDLQPEGVRKMLVQIRNQVHPDSQEAKMFDEIKKLINQDKSDKKSKEKKRKFYSMQILQMQEHHQTLQVQIRNDIVGTGRSVHQYFYQNVEKQWPQEPTQLVMIPEANNRKATITQEQVDFTESDKHLEEEANEEANLDYVNQFENESQKGDRMASGDEGLEDRLESNSPLFNEQFLRQTMSHDIRYESEERRCSDHLSDDKYEEIIESQALLTSKNKRTEQHNSRSNSQIYSLQVDNHQQDRIDDVRVDMTDKSALKRTKSFCQQNESVEQWQGPYENRPMEDKLSMGMHEILQTQEVEQSLSSQDNYVSDQGLKMPSGSNRTNQGPESTALARRASNQELVSYRARHQQQDAEALTVNKMTRTQQTFMNLRMQAQSSAKNLKITEFQNRHASRSRKQLADQRTQNSRSETAMNTTKNLFHIQCSKITENVDPSQNENHETNVTQRNWLLPKINVEGKSIAIERSEKGQRQDLKSMQSKTNRAASNSLPKIIRNDSIDGQENQSLEGHQTSLSFLNTSLQQQTVINDYQNNSYQSNQQNQEQNKIMHSKSEMQLDKDENEEGDEVERQQTLPMNDSQLDIFIRDYQRTPIVEMGQYQHDGKRNPIAQANHQSILTKFNLNSKKRKAEISSMLESIQQMPNNKSLRVKQSFQKQKTGLRQARSKVLNAELDKVLASPNFMPDSKQHKVNRQKPACNSVERVSWNVKKGGMINMYIPQNMQINKSTSHELYSLDAQQTLQAIRFKNLGHYSHNYSQKSQHHESATHRSYVTVGPYSKPELLHQGVTRNHSQSPSSLQSRNANGGRLNRNADIAVPAHLISKQIKRLRQRSTIMDKTVSPQTLDTQLYPSEVPQQ